jgi:hypothetical protein
MFFFNLLSSTKSENRREEQVLGEWHEWEWGGSRDGVGG